MGKPAARLTDMHVCPMSDGPKPHVGGPISGPGCPSVLIGGLPAARMGDMCVCVGAPDTIASGSIGVMIGGQPAARIGDQCAHGGKIVIGCPTVLIGEVMTPSITSFAAIPIVTTELVEPSTPFESVIASIGTMKSSTAIETVIASIGYVKQSITSQKKKLEKSEIQFKLVDQDGEPIAGENYKVFLPDGSIRTGKTDDKGEVDIAGIDPGICKISFPDIDENNWA